MCYLKAAEVYLQNRSSVLGCFLRYNYTVFDMVSHHNLKKKRLSYANYLFYISWYQKQVMKVQWGSSLSHGLSVQWCLARLYCCEG